MAVKPELLFMSCMRKELNGGGNLIVMGGKEHMPAFCIQYGETFFYFYAGTRAWQPSTRL